MTCVCVTPIKAASTLCHIPKTTNVNFTAGNEKKRRRKKAFTAPM
jgi:hypothetical protein